VALLVIAWLLARNLVRSHRADGGDG